MCDYRRFGSVEKSNLFTSQTGKTLSVSLTFFLPLQMKMHVQDRKIGREWKFHQFTFSFLRKITLVKASLKTKGQISVENLSFQLVRYFIIVSIKLYLSFSSTDSIPDMIVYMLPDWFSMRTFSRGPKKWLT